MKSALRLLIVSMVIASCAGIVLPSVATQPVIALSSGTGRVGLQISINGSGFLPTDTSCTFSSPSSGSVVSGAACVTRDGSVFGGFIVGNVLPGAYVVQASGNQGDFAQAILEITGGAQLGLSPATAQPGSDVSFQGTGFLPTDTTCTISSPSSPNPILPGTAACVIQNGTAFGSFTVGSVLPGEYVIQITGNQGDSAQTIIAVG